MSNNKVIKLKTYHRFSVQISLLMAGCLLLSSCITRRHTADVVVYGGTSAAVTAAVQASRMGKKVIIVSPDKHLGGLSSSGLGFTDTGNKEVIGGLAREFYGKVYDHYQLPEAWQWQRREEYGNKGQGSPAVDGAKRTQWIFEPHVAEEAFEQLIASTDVVVLRDEWLDRHKGVIKQGNTIRSIRTLSGKTFVAPVFIDATYEGDLMAAAGVQYVVGPEANAQWDEQWNGVQKTAHHHPHYFAMHVDPYVIPGDASSGLLPEISDAAPGVDGEGDKRIQAYTFRLCLTKNKDNRIAFSRPEDYDSTRYELLARIYEAGWKETFHKFDPIPNAKTDVNNHGPFSSDYIGGNYDYPEASYERRKEIIDEHIRYQKGLIWFTATDQRVPEEIRNQMQQWGYAADEFADNRHWPYTIYIREARRMMGQRVMTENEIMGRKPVAEPVGMGSYTLDSHNTQRYVTPDGYVQNEGDVGVGCQPYQIEMKSLLPHSDECSNLVVPVALSCTHIAFGSIRMEPVFMILGQSAATLAVTALEKGIQVTDIDYADVRPRLLADGQVLNMK